MGLLEWDESYSVKVEKCDEHHRKLFSLLNELHDAMKAGKGGQVIQSVVDALIDYTKYHFAEEEKLLEKTGYPALPSHRLQHQGFVRKVEEFAEDVKAGKVIGQSIAISGFLDNWLSQHIKQMDRQYSAHLNARGIH